MSSMKKIKKKQAGGFIPSILATVIGNTVSTGIIGGMGYYLYNKQTNKQTNKF